MASKQQRFQYFKSPHNGHDIAYDAGSQIYYDQTEGTVYDPTTGQWKKQPQDPKAPNQYTQLGMVGAGALTAGLGTQFGSSIANGGSSALDTIGGMFGLGSGGAPEAPAILNGAATTAAPTAGAAAAPATGGMSALGTAAHYVPAAAGAYGLYDVTMNPQRSEIRNTVQGAGSGAAIGWTFGGPIGSAIGGTVGGLYGLGTSLFHHTPNTRKEEGRINALRDQGQIIPEWWDAQTKTDIKDPHAWYNKDLAPDYVGMNNGTWTNNKFAMSRDVKDLQANDITGYAAFAEKLGNQWHMLDSASQQAIAQEALNKGLVKEHHGTIDVSWTPELEKKAQDLIADPKKKR